MTSWRYKTQLFLCALLSTIDLSKAGCMDYFELSDWTSNLTDIISLVRTKDSKDVVECTVERECLGNRGTFCAILYQCFRNKSSPAISEKCEGETSQNVHFYHFMCLVAKALRRPAKGCEYESVCMLHSEIASTAPGQTTTFPPTTPHPTTTTPNPTTATPNPTTATLPETAATTVWPSTAATSSQSTVSPDGNTSEATGTKLETSVESTLLALSVILNVALLVVCLYTWHQRRRERTQRIVTCVSNEGSPESQLMTRLEPSANGGVGASARLMEPPEPLTDVTSSDVC